VLAATVLTEWTVEQWPVALMMFEHLDKIDLEVANVEEQVCLELQEQNFKIIFHNVITQTNLF
jgi:hypothetical protein